METEATAIRLFPFKRNGVGRIGRCGLPRQKTLRKLILQQSIRSCSFRDLLSNSFKRECKFTCYLFIVQEMFILSRKY